ncbi:MAG: proliferating cell nuclear antigen (pcna) [Methanomassiliicoccales archaeon]|nr:proliferating cell nuclear antigen (pcna) [Methanomassiliicoccales archaeon]
MFKASVSDAKLWKSLLGAILTLIEEADFNATPDGIRLRSMDPAHVAMVDFEWRKAAFDEYSCIDPTKIRVSLASMLKLLKRVGSDEVLEMLYDDKTRKLNLTLKGKMLRKFTMPTLDPAHEEVPTPKITFNSKTKLTTSTLRDIIEDAEAVSDSIRLEVTPEKFTAAAMTELSSATIEMEKGNENLLELEAKEPSKATYNLNYLSQIAKAAAATAELVTVEFTTNMPIRLTFDIPQQGRLAYYLAPRIEATETSSGAL